jgi:DNA-binding NarL/FixJ family response regulator
MKGENIFSSTLSRLELIKKHGIRIMANERSNPATFPLRPLHKKGSRKTATVGYVLKNATSEEILEGIHMVASGERFLCDEVEILLKKDAGKRITLTGRERELLKLIVEGCSNDEIADRMCLAPQTIKGYRRNLVFKLNVHNTAQLIRTAIEQKLV